MGFLSCSGNLAFLSLLVRALEQLGVRDIDVDHLLAEWEKIPEYREPHPYQ